MFICSWDRLRCSALKKHSRESGSSVPSAACPGVVCASGRSCRTYRSVLMPVTSSPAASEQRRPTPWLSAASSAATACKLAYLPGRRAGLGGPTATPTRKAPQPPAPHRWCPAACFPTPQSCRRPPARTPWRHEHRTQDMCDGFAARARPAGDAQQGCRGPGRRTDGVEQLHAPDAGLVTPVAVVL
eukprot:scaffold17_cov302-Prasinococcus_capsulatus_cf.AAC.1